jgi:hypothetical protein
MRPATVVANVHLTSDLSNAARRCDLPAAAVRSKVTPPYGQVALPGQPASPDEQKRQVGIR